MTYPEITSSKCGEAGIEAQYRKVNVEKVVISREKNSSSLNTEAEEGWWRKSAKDISEYKIAELPSKPIYDFSKRVLDIVLSSIFLLLCLPLFLVIATAIKVTSPGPVLFKQKRVKKGGAEFWIYKFRTMVNDAELQLNRRPELKEQYLNDCKIKDDPRITRVGAFLRKTSLDETPQFINVLKGDISLIGPRALQAFELSRYGDDAGKILAVPAGLSGWWQVRGRNDTSYEQRVMMDVQYVEQRSFMLDLKLIVETAFTIFTCRGAY